MAALEVALPVLLRLMDLAVFALRRLPERDAEREAAVARLREMVEAGARPSDADFQVVLRSLADAAEQRDNIIALKGEEES